MKNSEEYINKIIKENKKLKSENFRLNILNSKYKVRICYEEIKIKVYKIKKSLMKGVK